MRPKYFVLYIIAGSIALIIAVYQLIAAYPGFNYRTALNVVIALIFYYLAYKTYHEKKDQELM